MKPYPTGHDVQTQHAAFWHRRGRRRVAHAERADLANQAGRVARIALLNRPRLTARSNPREPASHSRDPVDRRGRRGTWSPEVPALDGHWPSFAQHLHRNTASPAGPPIFGPPASAAEQVPGYQISGFQQQRNGARRMSRGVQDPRRQPKGSQRSGFVHQQVRLERINSRVLEERP